jgi:hypothetical protein
MHEDLIRRRIGKPDATDAEVEAAAAAAGLGRTVARFA